MKMLKKFGRIASVFVFLLAGFFWLLGSGTTLAEKSLSAPNDDPIVGAIIDVAPGQVEIVNDDLCSLREALSNAALDMVIFPDCPGGLGADIIRLGSNSTYTLDSELSGIASRLTIEGNGATIARDTVPAIPPFRIFTVDSSGDLSLNNLTLTNGESADNGGAILTTGKLRLENVAISANRASNGGGIYQVAGSLTITASDISGNRAFNLGGGLATEGGTVTIDESTFRNNQATEGGGLVTLSDQTSVQMVITNSRIEGNEATGDPNNILKGNGGGGMRLLYPVGSVQTTAVTVTTSIITNNLAINGGGIQLGAFQLSSLLPPIRLMVDRTTIANNRAIGENGQEGNGGAILNLNSEVHLVNSTLSGNLAQGNPQAEFSGVGGAIANGNAEFSGVGGAIANSSAALEAHIFLTNTSVVSNTGLAGGGLLNAPLAQGVPTPVVTFKNSLLAGNVSLGGTNFGPSCLNQGGTLISAGHNLEQANSCDFDQPSDQTEVDAKIAPLADNGGPTPTHALLDNSPAIDAANSATCPATDQRGVARPQGQGCDIGAYEAESTTVQYLYLPMTQK